MRARVFRHNEPVAVLDCNRQVIYANRPLLGLFRDCDLTEVMHYRPGELIGCRHGDGLPSGCGTTPDCTNCRFARSVARAEKSRRTVSFQAPFGDAEAPWLSSQVRVLVRPVRLNGEQHYFLTLHNAWGR